MKTQHTIEGVSFNIGTYNTGSSLYFLADGRGVTVTGEFQCIDKNRKVYTHTHIFEDGTEIDLTFQPDGWTDEEAPDTWKEEPEDPDSWTWEEDPDSWNEEPVRVSPTSIRRRVYNAFSVNRSCHFAKVMQCFVVELSALTDEIDRKAYHLAVCDGINNYVLAVMTERAKIERSGGTPTREQCDKQYRADDCLREWERKHSPNK